MFKAIRKILSHDCGPFWQFVKYGAIGVGATVIQTVVFYILASTCLPCLKADDWAVKLLSLPSAAVADSVRAWRFVIATALAFVAASAFAATAIAAPVRAVPFRNSLRLCPDTPGARSPRASRDLSI